MSRPAALNSTFRQLLARIRSEIVGPMKATSGDAVFESHDHGQQGHGDDRVAEAQGRTDEGRGEEDGR